VSRVLQRRDCTHHRETRDDHSGTFESLQVALEIGLSRDRSRHVHVEAQRALAQGDVDQMSTRAADRALHHVQDAHDQ